MRSEGVYSVALVALLLLTSCRQEAVQATVTNAATQSTKQPTALTATALETAFEQSPEQTPIPTNPNYEWTADEVVATEKLEATEEEIFEALKQSPSGAYPLDEDPGSGAFNFPGLLTSISYFKKGFLRS